MQVLGVEPYFCPSLSVALKAGKPVHADTTATLADGLAVPTVRFSIPNPTLLCKPNLVVWTRYTGIVVIFFNLCRKVKLVF